MKASDKARAYAKALFDLSVVSDTVDASDEGLRRAAKTIRGHAGLREALTGTGAPPETKRDVLREVFGGRVTPETLAIVTLAVDNGDVELLGDVARHFGEISETERGMVVAEVTTAVGLTEPLRKTLTEKLSASLGRPVALREQVDGSIVGGVVVRVAGRVLDGSVAQQLEEARSVLASTRAGGEATS